VVVLRAVDSAVAAFRQRFDPALARRIPAHVTVVFPFVEVADVDDELLDDVRDLYASGAPFDVELPRVERFEQHVWLAPEPKDLFLDLIDRTTARFPDHPPYGGVHGAVVPHLTIASGEDVDALFTAARVELGGALPLRDTADAVSLLQEEADGTWARHSVFPLGRPS
jgi:2'-5' RNA ligase